MRNENSVGSMVCGCGEKKDVRQSKKRGHYLYTVCPVCGLDQRTGAPVQNAIWSKSTFDREVIKPSNVVDDWKPKISEPVTEQPSEPVTEQLSEKPSEPSPTSLDLTEQELTAEATDDVALEQTGKRTGVVFKAVGWFAVIVGFVGAIWATA